MPALSQRPLLLSALIAAVLPVAAGAQNSSITVSASVQPRPLTLIDASLTANPGELRIHVDGCGSGALTVDVRSATGAQRASRAALDATATCMRRSVLLKLPAGIAGVEAFVVTLVQSQSLLSPAFAQFVVPASLVRERAGVAY
jgi:hypothetical protein